jgi:peptide/nickel transport system permease protein
MARYLFVRAVQGLVVVLLISVGTFIIMRLLPGDPVAILMGEGKVRISLEQQELIREKWGLNQPWSVQYWKWLSNMFRGDFGESLVRPGVPVGKMLVQAAPVTAKLNVIAIGLSLLLAIPMGIIAGVKRNSIFDYITAVGATLGVSLPNFWVGLMFIVIFAAWLRILPPFGLDSWKGFVLPVAVLMNENMATFSRVMRSGTIDVMSQDYVRTARAKGLSERVVVVRHAVRNALLPVVTVIGFQIAYILSGTIVVETVFAIPGIGRLFTDSVFRLDYQVVQSIVFVMTVIVVAINLFTDLVYALVDPRIRIS